ncbi:MAG: hypothetical protein K9M45_07615 [Kiritimatiellales bacterium]|nr:hypothetical protein [Kiritimatiellales bacterium]
MKKETTWRLVRFITFLPFLAFVPLATFTIHLDFFFWGFFIYLTLWAIACAIVEGKWLSKHWKKRFILRIIGVVGLQMIISFGLATWMMWDMYDVRGADGKLKSEQSIDSTRKTPVD